MISYQPSQAEIDAIRSLSKTEIDALKAKIKAIDPRTIFELNDKGEIVCPLCGNGTGNDKTGLTPENKGGVWLCNCLKGDCTFGGDNLKAIAQLNNLDSQRDFHILLATAAHICGVSVSTSSGVSTKTDYRRPTINAKPKAKDDTDNRELEMIQQDIRHAQENLKLFIESLPNQKWRGLTLETLEEAGCGYLSQWTSPKNRGKYPSRRVIVPCSGTSYLARAIDSDVKPAKQHAGTKTLFDPSNSLNGGGLILVLEGYLDALSIIQAAHYPVVALGGVQGGSLLIDALRGRTFDADKRPQFIILFDNDDSGRKAAPVLRDKLIKIGFAATVDFITDVDNNGKPVDANAILMAQGDTALEEKIREIVGKAKIELEQLREQMKSKLETPPIDDAENTVTTKTGCLDAPVELIVPIGYTFDSTGISVLNSKTGLATSVAKTPIVPTKRFIAPKDGDSYYYEISIKTEQAKWRRVILPANEVLDAKKVMVLVDSGAIFTSTTAKYVADWFMKLLGISENLRRLPAVELFTQPGWLDDDFSRFAYPTTHTIRSGNFDYAKAFSQRGDKDKWQQLLAQVISIGLVPRLVVGLALSAPLIQPLNVRNLQLHLCCPSGNGKTALTKFAMSVFGDPAKLMTKFNSTSNSIETMAFLMNDLPSAVDELQSANTKSRAAADELLYNFEAGVVRGRNTKYNNLQKPRYFHGTRLSTGEQAITTQSSGEGAISRVLEVSRAEIFSDDFARKVHRFCKKHFGWYGRAWIDYIIANKAAIVKDFEDREATYHSFNSIMPNHATTIAAAHTALIFFSQMLELDNLNEVCLNDAAELADSGELPRKGETSNADRAMKIIAEVIISHSKFFSLEDTEVGVETHGKSIYEYGFIRENGDVAFFSLALREILKDYPSVDAVLRDCAARGYLDCGNSKGLQKTVRKDGKTVKAYVFKKSALEKVSQA